MQEIMISAAASLIIAVVLGAFAIIRKGILKLLRRMELLEHKINALVYAISRDSNNGVMRYYREYLDGTIKDDEYVGRER
jgi:multisubunit Na+/H+ antiporter MnhC subunit